MVSFLPNFYFNNVTDVDLKILKKYNIKAILLDVDNTLTSNGNNIPYDGVYEWLNNIKQSEIKIMIISNNVENRVRIFAEKLSINYIANANKPFKYGFNKAVEILKVNKENILVMGDQIFTDILGANLSGMKSVLVDAKDKKEPFSIRVKRVFEIPLRLIIRVKCKKGRVY